MVNYRCNTKQNTPKGTTMSDEDEDLLSLGYEHELGSDDEKEPELIKDMVSIKKDQSKNKSLTLKFQFTDKMKLKNMESESRASSNSSNSGGNISKSMGKKRGRKPGKLKVVELKEENTVKKRGRGRPRTRPPEDEEEEEIEFDEDEEEEEYDGEEYNSSDDEELMRMIEQGEVDEKNVDLSKLSDRQRAKYLGQSEEPEELNAEFYNGKKLPKSVLALMKGNEKKKVLTPEEIELRKADAARKRKTFNARKLEAEKKETLRKLLHRKIDKAEVKRQEMEDERKRENKLKRREIIKHKALFSYVSKKVGEGIQSFYSMQL